MLNLSAGKELIAELLRDKYTADLIEIICDTIGLVLLPTLSAKGLLKLHDRLQIC